MSYYAVRSARPDEPGRWVITEGGLPNAVIKTGFFTRWGAMRRARVWTEKRRAAQQMYSVRER